MDTPEGNNSVYRVSLDPEPFKQSLREVIAEYLKLQQEFQKGLTLRLDTKSIKALEGAFSNSLRFITRATMETSTGIGLLTKKVTQTNTAISRLKSLIQDLSNATRTAGAQAGQNLASGIASGVKKAEGELASLEARMKRMSNVEPQMVDRLESMQAGFRARRNRLASGDRAAYTGEMQRIVGASGTGLDPLASENAWMWLKQRTVGKGDNRRQVDYISSDYTQKAKLAAQAFDQSAQTAKQLSAAQARGAEAENRRVVTVEKSHAQAARLLKKEEETAQKGQIVVEKKHDQANRLLKKEEETAQKGQIVVEKKHDQANRMLKMEEEQAQREQIVVEKKHDQANQLRKREAERDQKEQIAVEKKHDQANRMLASEQKRSELDAASQRSLARQINRKVEELRNPSHWLSTNPYGVTGKVDKVQDRELGEQILHDLRMRHKEEQEILAAEKENAALARKEASERRRSAREVRQRNNQLAAGEIAWSRWTASPAGQAHAASGYTGITGIVDQNGLIRNQNELNKLAKDHEKTQSKIGAGLMQTAINMGKWLVFYRLVRDAMMIVERGITSFVQKGVEYTRNLELQQLGLRAILYDNFEVWTKGEGPSKQLEGVAAVNALQAESVRQWQQLQSASLAVVGSTQDLMLLYNAMLPHAVKLRANTQDVQELTKAAAVAAGVLDISFQDVRSAMVSLLQGRYLSRNRLVAVLGFDKAELDKLKGTPQLMTALKGSLEAFQIVADDAQKTLGALTESFAEFIGKIGSEALSPFIAYFKQTVGTLQSALFESFGKGMRIRPETAAFFTFLRESIVEIVSPLRSFGADIHDQAQNSLPQWVIGIRDGVAILTEVTKVLVKAGLALSMFVSRHEYLIKVVGPLLLLGGAISIIKKFNSALIATANSGGAFGRLFTYVLQNIPAYRNKIEGATVSTGGFRAAIASIGTGFAIGAVIAGLGIIIDKLVQLRIAATDAADAEKRAMGGPQSEWELSYRKAYSDVVGGRNNNKKANVVLGLGSRIETTKTQLGDIKLGDKSAGFTLQNYKEKLDEFDKAEAQLLADAKEFAKKGDEKGLDAAKLALQNIKDARQGFRDWKQSLYEMTGHARDVEVLIETVDEKRNEFAKQFGYKSANDMSKRDQNAALDYAQISEENYKKLLALRARFIQLRQGYTLIEARTNEDVRLEAKYRMPEDDGEPGEKSNEGFHSPVEEQIAAEKSRVAALQEEWKALREADLMSEQEYVAKMQASEIALFEFEVDKYAERKKAYINWIGEENIARGKYNEDKKKKEDQKPMVTFADPEIVEMMAKFDADIASAQKRQNVRRLQLETENMKQVRETSQFIEEWNTRLAEKQAEIFGDETLKAVSAIDQMQQTLREKLKEMRLTPEQKTEFTDMLGTLERLKKPAARKEEAEKRIKTGESVYNVGNEAQRMLAQDVEAGAISLSEYMKQIGAVRAKQRQGILEQIEGLKMLVALENSRREPNLLTLDQLNSKLSDAVQKLSELDSVARRAAEAFQAWSDLSTSLGGLLSIFDGYKNGLSDVMNIVDRTVAKLNSFAKTMYSIQAFIARFADYMAGRKEAGARGGFLGGMNAFVDLFSGKRQNEKPKYDPYKADRDYRQWMNSYGLAPDIFSATSTTNGSRAFGSIFNTPAFQTTPMGERPATPLPEITFTDIVSTAIVEQVRRNQEELLDAVEEANASRDHGPSVPEGEGEGEGERKKWKVPPPGASKEGKGLYLYEPQVDYIAKLKGVSREEVEKWCLDHGYTIKPAKETGPTTGTTKRVASTPSTGTTAWFGDKTIDNAIAKYSKEYDVPDALVQAVIRAESGGNQKARSSVGAIGLMQLMPDTAKAKGVNPYSAEENIKGGVMYLRELMNRYANDFEKALAAYNMGPTAFDRRHQKPWPETRQYVRKIVADYQEKTTATYAEDLTVTAPNQAVPLAAPGVKRTLSPEALALLGGTVQAKAQEVVEEIDGMIATADLRPMDVDMAARLNALVKEKADEIFLLLNEAISVPSRSVDMGLLSSQMVVGGAPATGGGGKLFPETPWNPSLFAVPEPEVVEASSPSVPLFPEKKWNPNLFGAPLQAAATTGIKTGTVEAFKAIAGNKNAAQNAGNAAMGLASLVPGLGVAGMVGAAGSGLSAIGGLFKKKATPANAAKDAAGGGAGGFMSVAGPIGMAAGAVFAIGSALFARAVEKAKKSIKGSFEKVAKAIDDGTTTMGQGVADMQKEREDAVAKYSKSKSGRKALKEMLPEIDDQIAALKKRIKDIQKAFEDNLIGLRSGNGPFGDWARQLLDLQKTTKEYLDSFTVGTKEYAQAFANVEELFSITLKSAKASWEEAMRGYQGEALSAQENVFGLVDEQKSLYEQMAETAQRELDIRKQIADIMRKAAEDEAAIRRRGVLEAQLTIAEQKAIEISQVRDKAREEIADANKQLTDIGKQRGDIDTQIELNRIKLEGATRVAEIESLITGSVSDRFELERRRQQIEIENASAQVLKWEETKRLIDSVVDTSGGLTFVPPSTFPAIHIHIGSFVIDQSSNDNYTETTADGSRRPRMGDVDDQREEWRRRGYDVQNA